MVRDRSMQNADHGDGADQQCLGIVMQFIFSPVESLGQQLVAYVFGPDAVPSAS